MIQFHFQYYWYAIIFLVFDVAFMFLVLGGMVASDATAQDLADSARAGAVAKAKDALLVLCGYFAIMSLGVWYVFRKRGRLIARRQIRANCWRVCLALLYALAQVNVEWSGAERSPAFAGRVTFVTSILTICSTRSFFVFIAENEQKERLWW